MLKNLPADDFDRIYKAQLAEKEKTMQELFERTKSSKNRLWSAMPTNSKADRA